MSRNPRLEGGFELVGMNEGLWGFECPFAGFSVLLGSKRLSFLMRKGVEEWIPIMTLDGPHRSSPRFRPGTPALVDCKMPSSFLPPYYHYYPLLPPTTPYYPLLPPTTPYYPLLPPTTPYYPLLPPTTPYYPLLPPDGCRLPLQGPCSSRGCISSKARQGGGPQGSGSGC